MWEAETVSETALQPSVPATDRPVSAPEPPPVSAQESLEPPLARQDPPASALDWSVENCTIAATLGILGEKWTFIVLRDVFLGIRRFDDFIEHTGIPRQVLANRLATLVDQGLLKRDAYRESGARARPEYRLTDKGIDAYPILVALREWGDRYAADPAGPPLLTVHRDCGASVSVHLRCANGHELTSPREVVPRPGPSARPRIRSARSSA